MRKVSTQKKSNAELEASIMRGLISTLTPDVNEIQSRNRRACRACDNTRGNKLVAGFHSVYECASCHAIFGSCYLGDSYSLVLPYFSKSEISPERQRYFDFSTLGSTGETRRHGWFDPQTKLITQVG